MRCNLTLQSPSFCKKRMANRGCFQGQCRFFYYHFRKSDDAVGFIFRNSIITTSEWVKTALSIAAYRLCSVGSWPRGVALRREASDAKGNRGLRFKTPWTARARTYRDAEGT